MGKKQSLGKGLLIIIYIALKPIYLRSSGTLQIADVFLVLVSLYLIISRKGRLKINSDAGHIITLLSVLCLYQFIINLIWTAITGVDLLRSTLYYIFNLVAFVLFLLIGEELGKKTLNRAIMLGCLVSLSVTSVGLLFTIGAGRGLSFFNNPNQLGYYALIMFTFILFCSDDLYKPIKAAMIIMSVWAVIASSSKAAFIGVIISAVLYTLFYEKKKTVQAVMFQLIAIATIGILLYIFFFSNNQLVLSNNAFLMMRRRILSMSTENDTSLGIGRGYDRIKEIGFNILWGVGEGAFYRFQTMHGMEVHSTFAALAVSYGLFGLIGYIVVFFESIKHNTSTFRNFIILSGVLSYQVSHNGIRNTLLWLLLATLIICKYSENNNTNINERKNDL